MIELIHRYICKKRNISPEKIIESHPNGQLKRDRESVLCRQLIAYYAMLNGYTEREAGEYFGKQDHSTAHHAKTKINGYCDIYRDFAFDVAEYDKALIGLRGLNDKELLIRLEYDDKQKIEYINNAVKDSEANIKRLEKRMESLKATLNEIKEKL